MDPFPILVRLSFVHIVLYSASTPLANYSFICSPPPHFFGGSPSPNHSTARRVLRLAGLCMRGLERHLHQKGASTVGQRHVEDDRIQQHECGAAVHSVDDIPGRGWFGDGVGGSVERQILAADDRGGSFR